MRPITTSTPAQRAAKVAQRLQSDATGYEFLQAVRLLSRLQPGRTAIGGWADPANEPVRLSVPPSLAFPPSEVASISLPTAGKPEPARMAVRFLGLTGAQGVLPHVYSEHAATRARARDTAFRDFLDLFHHRLLSLFYRAAEYNRPQLAAERGEEDRLRAHLLDLVGAGTRGIHTRHVSPDTLARYAGLFAIASRPAEGLAQLVSSYFVVPASIEQFVGEWRRVPNGGQQCLDDEGPDGRLGCAVIGDAIYDPQARVRLRLGPLTRAQFEDFLPSGRSHAALAELARLYTNDQVGVDAQLVLKRDDVPAATLGSDGSPTLGFGTWVRSRAPTGDRDDVHLTLC
jgi:type VI secretion system protein ImpH